MRARRLHCKKKRKENTEEELKSIIINKKHQTPNLTHLPFRPLTEPHTDNSNAARHTDTHTHTQTDGRTDRRTDGRTDRKTERQAGRQAGSQRDRETDRLNIRMINGRKYIEVHQRDAVA